MPTLKKNVKNIPLPTHFGKNLKFLRRMKGLTQTQLASQLGMSRNNIASYESGMVEPNVDKFLKACAFFGAEPNDMLQTILSEHPNEVSPVQYDTKNIVDKYLFDQLDQFVIQTNEMTKVLDGYRAFFDMKKDAPRYNENKEMYSTLGDLLELLQNLIAANWGLIQSVYPQEENDLSN